MAKTTPTSDGPKAGNGGAPVAPQVGAPQAGAAPTGKKVKSGTRRPLDTKWHPDLKPGPDGEPTAKLTAWPADFKTTQHKPLSIKHFEDPAVFYIGKAERFERMAADLRKQAETCKALGGISDKGAAKKLGAVMKRMDDLKAELAGKGIDVEAMLQLLLAKKAEGQAPAQAQTADQAATAAQAG